MQTSYGLDLAHARAGLKFGGNPHNVWAIKNYSKKEVLITPTAVNSTVYNTTVAGQLATYTSDGSATAAEICAGLVSAINGLSGTGVTATDNLDGTYTLKGNVAGVDFTYVFSGAGSQTALELVTGVQVVPFGAFVTVLSGNSRHELEGRLPNAAADITGGAGAGIALHTHALVTNPNTTVSGYAQKDIMSVLRQGEVWVQPEQAVAVGDPIYVRYKAGSGGSQLGAIRKDADSTTAAQVPNGSKFLTSCSANGFAVALIKL